MNFFVTLLPGCPKVLRVSLASGGVDAPKAAARAAAGSSKDSEGWWPLGAPNAPSKF